MSGAEVPLLSGGADLLAEEAAGLQEQLRDADFLCLNTFDFSLVCLLQGGFGSLRSLSTGVVLQCSAVMLLCCVAVFPGEFQSSDYEMPDDAGKTETLFPPSFFLSVCWCCFTKLP